MVKTAIQLYTLHDFDVSQADKVRIAGETNVDGVEMVFDGVPSPETQRALEETGLQTLSISVGLDVIEENFEEVVKACDAVNTDTVVLGHLAESYVDSPESARETGRLLSDIASRFANEDLDFIYHTHRYEFDETDGRSHFEVLKGACSDGVEFEIDLGWAAVAGADPVEILKSEGTDIRSVHLKDMDVATEEFVNLGEGDLDVKADAKAAIEAGVEWLVYEHEDPSDPVESVVTGASTLQKAVEEATPPNTGQQMD